MKHRQELTSRIQGWFPQEPKLAYAQKALNKHRWQKPYWIALTLVSIILLGGISFFAVTTYMRYSNPQADITASYFEKSLNCTQASVGDIVEVKVMVNWHGYIFPEFRRQVNIIDPFPESNFKLVSGNNTYQYSGYGGGEQFTYELMVIGGEARSLEFPKPTLYLDNIEIVLNGQRTVLEITP